MRLIDLTGQRFGRLVVIERAKSGRHTRWICKCDCGKSTQVYAHDLRRGDTRATRSCGCLQRELTRKRVTKDVTGQKFGRLTALHPTGKNSHGDVIWRLRCDCGNEIEHSINSLGIKTRSCGCLR
jgi:hypothetical protein